MQGVEALGHGVMCDAVTLKQVAAHVNDTDGIKSRFSHPGACEDSTGKMLGRIRDAKVIGDKVVGDLHLSQSARKSPSGNLYDYVMARAQEDPASFGMSVVVSGESVWTLKDGTEISAGANGEVVARPTTALTEKPTLRVKKLHAVDVVDEPAANRDGMFSGTTAELSEEMFQQLDLLASERNLSHEKLAGFAIRYFATRGVMLAIAPKKPPVPIASLPSYSELLERKNTETRAVERQQFIASTLATAAKAEADIAQYLRRI